MSHRSGTYKSKDSRITNITTKAKRTQRKQSSLKHIPRKAAFCSLLPASLVSPFQILLVKQSCPVSTKSRRGGNCLVRHTRSTHRKAHTHKQKCVSLIHCVCLCVLACMCRSVPAILWWGWLLQVPPVSQQQRPVLVCGSLWQRGGQLTHPWPCKLR